MKRFVAVGAALAVALAFSATPATAGKKPVKTTLYLHGNEVVGETESMSLVADALLPMDKNKPTGSQPKSKFITNYVAGPNYYCAVNNLFPVWTGELSGTIKGDMKVTLHTLGTPGPVEVRVWPDIASQMCTTSNPVSASDDYPEPAGAVTVDMPAGHGATTAVIKGVNFKATSSLLLQVSPVVAFDIPDPGGSLLHPFVARVLYDTPDMASSIEFKCIPAKGRSCTP